jgi:PAS domain S-box-containing protein
MLKNRKIRDKLLISYSLVLILSISLGCLSIYFFVRTKLTSALESELNNTTQAILNLVRTSVAVSIKNYLRAVAEKNMETIHFYYEQQQKGLLSEQEAKNRVTQLLLAQTIGDSGYIYCMDSIGNVLVHPQTALRGVNVADFGFVRQQLTRKKGYLEYDWKNPDETTARPKSLYMLYFEPWDWILSATSYRNEFMSLVNMEDFEKGVLDLRFGETGYSFVIDGKGNAVIHPKIQGVNIFSEDEYPDQYLREMQRRKSGKTIYAWKNPGEKTARDKLVIFNHIPEFDWIVGSSSYLDEFYAPLDTIRSMIIATALVTFLLVLPISGTISTSITRPLKRLMDHFDHMVSGDFSSRMEPRSNDEIGQLAVYYNRFADRIEDYRKDLNQQMEKRRRTEEALRESEARYRSVMEAAPDPIVVYDMKGLVTYLNPAFTRIFGWSIQECLGRKMDHFVPEENWEETRRMIATMLAGETLSAVPTRRYTRMGDTVEVSISGATFRNRMDELEGSVIILRDVTKSRRLQQQVMEIGDQVRRHIGQDLHDDLCPHLIGTHGLTAVLAENLSEESSAQAPRAEKISELLNSAIAKARTLARGLCPVHLAGHGFIAALEDMARQTEAAFDVACRFDCDDRIVLADNAAATHLYYIAQEAVQNAVKHADSDTISIRLYCTDKRIHLQIADDGKGLPVPLESNGIGLQIMPFRSKMINADFRIDSGAKTGTAVNVFLNHTTPPIH